MRPDIDPHPSRLLLAADVPFVFDEGHGVINALGGQHLVASDGDQMEGIEFLVAVRIAEAPHQTFHVIVDGDQDRFVMDGERGDDFIARPALADFAMINHLMAAPEKRLSRQPRRALVQQDFQRRPRPAHATSSYVNAASISRAVIPGYCALICATE